MFFYHLADLHIGKVVHGVSMLDNGDQRFWIDRFLELVDKKRPDAIVISGDVYDRSAPSGDSVELLDYMLTEIVKRDVPVLMVAGNHDSGQRLAFGSEILARHNLHICGGLGEGGEMMRVVLNDEFGPVTFWLCPYVFPTLVAQKLGDDSIKDYDTAMRRLIERQGIDSTGRNVLVAHQNVVANGQMAEFGGSESVVGGVGQIDFSAFDCFDYVALGHIHSSYHVGRKEVMYAGTPLCYHFNETRQKNKGTVMVHLGKKGSEVEIQSAVIEPKHVMRAVSGDYEDVVATEKVGAKRGEYVSVTITDRRITPEIAAYFREFYGSRESVLMELISSFRNSEMSIGKSHVRAEERSLEELFTDFYRFREGDELSDVEARALQLAIESMHSVQSGDSVGDSDVTDFVSKLIKELNFAACGGEGCSPSSSRMDEEYCLSSGGDDEGCGPSSGRRDEEAGV